MDWNFDRMEGGGLVNGMEFRVHGEFNCSFTNQDQTEIVCLDLKKKGKQSTRGVNVNILHVRLINSSFLTAYI